MAKKELNDAFLECVSGGELKMEVVEKLLKFIPLSKVVGKDKFDFMRDIHELWEKHNNELSTDGSNEDYLKLMNIILEAYDSYDFKK